MCGPYGSIWPRPTGQISLSKNVTPIHPDAIKFDFTQIPESNDLLATRNLMIQMKQKFLQDLKTVCNPGCIKVCDTNVVIKISTVSSDVKITWNTDESYQLRVNTVGKNIVVYIHAMTIFGARHALETLFQLTTVVQRNDTRSLILISEASILDQPVYPHRGLLIDTSRNYLKISTIENIINGMAHSKMNVLHWHATDSHSFPLQLPRIPEMAEYGAYSSREVYTLQDISDILHYAKIRGIRVLMEIDSPAHAGNGWQWGEKSGLGKLAVCINQTPWRTYCIQPPCGQLNPFNLNTYKILGSIYKDLISVFPKGESFHMGGDELTFECWNSTDEIVEQMKKEGLDRNYDGFLQLWANFHLKSMAMLDDIRGSSKTPIILWSSQLTTPENIHLLNNQTSKIIIQTWVEASDPIPAALLNLNYKLIMSTKDAWYLDHGVWGRTVYHPWSKVYDNRIPEFSKGVLGGEVCMWGEYVDDSAVESRIWPRAAAAAERLWSDPKNSSSLALTRFLQHRERLVQMGIHAEAIIPEWCFQNDDQCS
ncbi:chitooligosaccharidolytic beta-N-acetylglucosaminidase isoform X2 [Planococcus citri]